MEKPAISMEVAKSYCSNLSIVTREIDRIRASYGEETSDIGELKMAPARRIPK